MSRLSAEDYDQDCCTLAEFLLGKVLARKMDDGKILKGIIVETEAYLGGHDKASHSYNGKVTERNKPMYAIPGTSYVYAIYGMYFCINISSKGPGAAVLIRALEPLVNAQEMHRLRDVCRKNIITRLRDKDLCSGPSKLCISMNITKELNNVYLPDSDVIWIENPPERLMTVVDMPVVRCPRIGIEKCGAEWASKPFRFYLFGNPHVSRRDKKREQEEHLY